MPKAKYITDEATLLAGVGKTKTATILKEADPKLLNNMEFMKKAVAITPYAIKYIGKPISETKWGGYDRDNFCEFFAINGMAYQYAPLKIKNEPMAAFAAISNTLDVIPFLNHAATYRMGLHFAGESTSDGNFDRPLAKDYCGKPTNTYLCSRNVAIFVSKHFSNGFSSLAKYNYADDEEIVRIAVETNGRNLIYASDRLKNNVDICKIAFMQSSDAFEDKSLSKSRSVIVSDREFIKEYLSKAKTPRIPEEYRDDDEIAALGLYTRGDNFFTISERLRGSKNHAMIAFETCGDCLKYASDRIKDDKDVVKVAVKNSGYALMYASAALKGDKDIVELAVKNSGTALKYASDSLKDDDNIVKAAVESDCEAFEYASDRLKKDWGFIKELLENAKDEYGFSVILHNVDNTIIKNNESVKVLAPFLAENIELFYCLSCDKTDISYILDIIDEIAKCIGETKPFAVLEELPRFAQDDESVVATCVGYNPKEFESASERLWCDKNFTINLMTTLDVDLYEYIYEDLLCDKDIVKLHEKFELKKKVSRIVGK